MKNRLVTGLAFAATLASIGATTVAASAAPYDAYAAQQWNYDRWQPGWDNDEFDRRHVILGRVVGFQPYRLELVRRDGAQQTIDLKNGTVIRPTNMTPQPGQRVAVVGYYSRGTFIANRVVLRY